VGGSRGFDILWLYDFKIGVRVGSSIYSNYMPLNKRERAGGSRVFDKLWLYSFRLGGKSGVFDIL